MNNKVNYRGEKSDWEGFTQYVSELDSRTARIVVPEEELPGRPWIWRARFFGAFANADIELLKKGFHIAHIDVTNLFGGPEALKLWDKFYVKLISELGFSEKAVLEGMSRGGLILYNWAKRNPEKVSCIYADAPVCDFKSWPGMDREAFLENRDLCLKAYGFTVEEALKFRDNPIDNLEKLAEASVPVLHVCGDCDESVPMEENTNILMERYKALGGDFKLIVKEGGAHHPHGLDDPAPIVDFILKAVNID
ncbi:MAG: alpha/beta fold hydrolase [Planctomycetota bacterium]|jgi:pimeloyl-ACP methyl ester carboxylesterase